MPKRVDANQKPITKELRDLGFSVSLTHEVGKGFPDIVVGFMGLNVLIELKVDEKKKLTEAEEQFFNTWKGQVSKSCSSADVIEEMMNALDTIIKNKEEIFEYLNSIERDER
jgi:hypothetical protein